MIDSKVLAQTLVKLSQSKDAEKSILEFFKYLGKKNYLGLLPQIKKHIERLGEASSEAQTVVISTKHDLSELETKEILSLVGAESSDKVEIIQDETVVGGFSVTYQGNIYDGSLRNQITQLRKRLTH